MRAPPPLTRVPAYPITAGAGMLAIAVTVLVSAGKWDIERFVVNPESFTHEPWRLVISALPHAFDLGKFDVFHLPFNLYWLWVFGTLLEEVYGHIKTLALFVLLGAGSAAAEYALFSGGIGLSGITYGYFGALWFLSPRDPRFAGGVDTRTTQLMVAWFFFCIVTTATNTMPVANVAHGVGALLGALVGAAASAREIRRRTAAGVGIAVVCAASWVGATSLRPRINLAEDSHGSFKLAYEAYEEGRYDEAITHYKAAVAVDPDNSGAWYNLGIAYQQTERADDAYAAYKRAYELSTTTLKYRDAYVQSCRVLGYAAARGEDAARSVELFETVTGLDPSDRYAWGMLADGYETLGRREEAAAARRHLAAPPWDDE